MTTIPQVVWQPINDVEGFVRAILAAEADDIPHTLIDARPWYAADFALDAITVDHQMIVNHNADPIHQQRRDAFENAIRAGIALPPLIVLGPERFLVDGYARFRALRRLGISTAWMLCQQR